jgi:hypothetical protein
MKKTINLALSAEDYKSGTIKTVQTNTEIIVGDTIVDDVSDDVMRITGRIVNTFEWDGSGDIICFLFTPIV